MSTLRIRVTLAKRGALVLSILAIALLATLWSERSQPVSAAGGSISGTVTDENTGEFLDDVCVEFVDVLYAPFGIVCTDPTGSYVIDGLPPGEYKLHILDFGHRGYLDEWYDDQPDFDSADLVTVTADQETHGVDVALGLGGSVNGTVTSENTGEPLETMCVALYGNSHGAVGWGVTDAEGQYTVGGLRPDDYRVLFRDCNYPVTYVSEWYDDEPDMGSATLVAVTAKEKTAGIDAALAIGGTINGTVTGEDTGDPLEGIRVEVYDGPEEPLGYGYTDHLGRYAIEALPTGDYKVFFRSGTGGYAEEWYNNQPDFDSADPVAVVEKEKTPDIDAALAPLGTINGTVTDENTGEPIEGICVRVYDGSHHLLGSGVTDASGNYNVVGLGTGDYRVYFDDCSGSPAYLSEWYDGQPDFDSADPVAVIEHEKTGGVDAALALGGIISGTVTDENTGDPLWGICVTVYHGSYGWSGYDRTDGLGHYSVGGLTTGDYEVQFKDCSEPQAYLPEWYDDQPDFESAHAVTVIEKEETGGIDAALTLGGTINGTVTDETTGDPLQGICVDATGGSSGSVFTDAAGTYNIAGLPAGNYRVRFKDCSSSPAYLSEWYNDRPDSASADLVAVTQKQKTAGIDAALALGGTVNGTVTSERTGEPIEGIRVDVADASYHLLGSSATDSAGNYSVGGLPTGSYKVHFEDDDVPPIYLSEWYDDQSNFSSADLVGVMEKEKTGGIDAALAGTGLDLSIEVAGTTCSTKGGDAKCSLSLGDTFTLNVLLNSLPSMVTEYEGLDIILQYAGVTSKNNADMSAYWPECLFEAWSYPPGFAAFGCVTFQESSTYTGIVGAIDFNCDTSGSITLIGSGAGDSGLLRQTYTYHEGTDETLTINCVAPPPPTPTVPPVGGAGAFPNAAGREGSGLTIGGADFIVLAALAAVIALGGATWHVRRRRAGG